MTQITLSQEDAELLVVGRFALKRHCAQIVTSNLPFCGLSYCWFVLKSCLNYLLI